MGKELPKYTFELPFTVRDYECDLQGIVNNAVYQNYLEHARHEYLKSVGLDFAAFTKKGINLVVMRAELEYRLPLKSGDQFVVCSNFLRESMLRFAFLQDIYRLPERTLMLKAKITGTALSPKGRPELPPEITNLFTTGNQ